MASVVLNGHTYTDDANPSTGLAGGGHRIRFIPALVDMLAVADGANAAAADAQLAVANALNAPAANGTSTDSLTIGYGAQSLTTQTGRGFSPGMKVMCAYTANPAVHYMYGTVTSYNTSTGLLGFTCQGFEGSGAHAGWSISLAAILSGTASSRARLFYAAG